MDQWQYLLVPAGCVLITLELAVLRTGLFREAEYWIRFPFDIPVEDFLFGWSLVTAVLLLWEKQRARSKDRRDRQW